jgi:hypothetical protein
MLSANRKGAEIFLPRKQREKERELCQLTWSMKLILEICDENNSDFCVLFSVDLNKTMESDRTTQKKTTSILLPLRSN